MMTVEKKQVKKRGLLGRFRRDEDGSTTIEFVLWFPFLLAIMGLIADASLAFLNVNRMYDAAREGARRAAVGSLTMVETQQYILDTLPGFISPVITVTDSGTEDVLVQLSAPMANLSFFGVFDAFTVGNVDISYTLRKEV